MILLADSNGPDQTARMRRLIWAFALRIYPKTRVRMMRATYSFVAEEKHILNKINTDF